MDNMDTLTENKGKDVYLVMRQENKISETAKQQLKNNKTN